MTAHFVKKEYELTVDTSGRGHVTETLVKNKTYEHGAIVRLTAEPGTAYEFVEWTGDINRTINPAYVQMDEPKSVRAKFRQKSTSALLDVYVDWNVFNGLTAEAVASMSDSITHFGVSLLYDDSTIESVENSVSKQDVNGTERVSLEATSSQPARLLATAVKEGENYKKAFFFGVLNNITVSPGSHYRWTVNDFNWQQASWKVVDSLSTAYQNGTFHKNRTDPPFELWILVNSPYQTDPNVDILDMFVRVFDGGATDSDTRAQEGGYENGFREWIIEAENQNRPDPDTTYHTFEPYVVGPKFALPSKRYLVGEKGVFRVIWK